MSTLSEEFPEIDFNPERREGQIKSTRRQLLEPHRYSDAELEHACLVLIALSAENNDRQLAEEMLKVLRRNGSANPSQ